MSLAWSGRWDFQRREEAPHVRAVLLPLLSMEQRKQLGHSQLSQCVFCSAPMDGGYRIVLPPSRRVLSFESEDVPAQGPGAVERVVEVGVCWLHNCPEYLDVLTGTGDGQLLSLLWYVGYPYNLRQIHTTPAHGIAALLSLLAAEGAF